MYTIHIRVEEGNKEAFLECLDGLRKTLDFEFQVDQELKEENLTERQGGKLLSATSTLSVVIESSDAEVTEPSPKGDCFPTEPMVGSRRGCPC